MGARRNSCPPNLSGKMFSRRKSHGEMDLENHSCYGNQFTLSPKFSEDVSKESMEIECCFKSHGPFSHDLF